MRHPTTLPSAALAAVLLSACAHAAATNQAARRDLAAPPALESAAAADEATGPPSIVVTGSRIPQRVDLVTGLPRTTSPLTVYQRAQLDRTGVVDTGLALQRLTP
jgi:hypothetical protein